MNRQLAGLRATALFAAGMSIACGPATVLAGLDQGDASSKGDAAGSGSSRDSGNPACSPPANATQTPITFTGALFDSAQGCLTGAPVPLPICGCFTDVGLDSSTWCFVDPDGTTYFGISSDQCTVQIPPGWYATQTFGPTPFGTPTSAQQAACDRVAATSTATGSYDMPGPPQCDAGGGMGDGGDSEETASGPCDPLAPPPVTLGTILGVGEDSQSVYYVGEEAPDGGENRVFVSDGNTLYRKWVAGSGATGSGLDGNADYTLSFQDSVSDASDAQALLIQERDRAMTVMALGPADSKSFYTPDAGDELLTVVDASAIAHFKIQNLPFNVEYVAVVSDGNVFVVSEPMDIADNAFRIFYCPASAMIEYPIVTFNREDAQDDLSFTIGATTYTAHLAFVSSFSGDAGLGPSSLDTSGSTLQVTERIPTPTSLSGFSFTCLGSVPPVGDR